MIGLERPVWRPALAINAAVAVVGLAIKIADAVRTADPAFPSPLGRLTNELCYFTIDANVIVAVVSGLLALDPVRWRWLAGAARLTGLVSITITAVVYYGLLAAQEHLTGVALVGDVLAHAVSPALFVGTWLVAGPRRSFTRHDLALVTVFPACWIALTLVRGAVTDRYPYDFVDVSANGYPTVLLTIGGLTGVAVGMAAFVVRLERRGSVKRRSAIAVSAAP